MFFSKVVEEHVASRIAFQSHAQGVRIWIASPSRFRWSVNLAFEISFFFARERVFDFFVFWPFVGFS